MTSIHPPTDRYARLLTGLGIALPVIMMVGFIAYASWQRSSVPMPQHALLVSVPDWNEVSGMAGVRYVVEDERVVAYPSLELNVTQRLYRLDPVTLRAKRLEITHKRLPLAGPVEVVSMSAIRVSGERIAPDGYAMTDGYQDGPGIIGELFGRRRHGGIGLTRDGVTHWSKDTEHVLSQWNVVFVGWVLND